jgi:hypothetical protein
VRGVYGKNVTVCGLYSNYQKMVYSSSEHRIVKGVGGDERVVWIIGVFGVYN